MTRKLIENMRSMDLPVMLAVACVALGALVLQGLADEREQRIEALDGLIDKRRAELRDILAEKGRAMNAEAPAYPSPGDVDPLHRGEEPAAPVPAPE